MFLRDNETWLPVPGFEGYYEVSDLGRVRSLDRVVPRPGSDMRIKGKILKPEYRRNTGYLMIKLVNGDRVKKYYMHRLVLTVFRGEPEPGQEGCHANDIRTDNRLCNLRWDTHLANVGDAMDRGRHRCIGSYNRDKTHCDRGHPFDEKNTIIRPTGRSCRTCRLLKERERYHARKSG